MLDIEGAVSNIEVQGNEVVFTSNLKGINQLYSLNLDTNAFVQKSSLAYVKEGVLVDDIIKTHQTPLYVYSQKSIIKSYKELKQTLNSEIFYAVDEKVKTVKCNKKSKKACNGKSTKCITHNLWDELEIHINTFFEKRSLRDLVNNNK